jgi:hypothetical protein
VGTAVIGLAIVGLLAPGAGAGEDFVAGSGRARASLFEIVPRTGGLTIPVNLSRALATYQETAATATSTAVKPPAPPAAGDCGGKAPGPGRKDNPGPRKPPGFAFPFLSTLEVSSTDKDAEAGRQADMAATPEASPVEAAFQHQEVRATRDPLGQASTTAGVVSFQGIETSGGRVEATTGVTRDGTRLAHALVVIHRLNILDAVILEDLRWEANQRTGANPGTEGSFTVGRVIPGGPRLPGATLPATGDPLAAVNQLLAPTGLGIDPPRVDDSGGTVRVTPLSLRLADSAVGRQVVGPLVAAFQPVRDPLVQGLLGVSCDFGTAVTVADVAAGMLSGSGGISFDIGGVSATTEGTRYDNPFAGPVDGNLGAGPLDGGAALAPEPIAAPGSAPGSLPATSVLGVDEAGRAAGTPGDGGSDGLTGATASGSGAVGGTAAPGFPEAAYVGPAARRLPGHRGGAALAVGLLGVTAVVALAGADAFHLRRGSRTIP